MKKKIILLATIFAVCFISSVNASSLSFPCYSFDFSVSVNTEQFPTSEQTRISGYADLIENILVKGQFVYSETTSVVNLYVELIPQSNPSSSVCFNLYGIPSHMMLSSPLLGDQVIAFNNMALLEFSVKAYQYLGFPVQYLSLLFPYVHESAFESSLQIWNKHFGKLNKVSRITKKEIRSFAKDLEATVNQDRNLYYWIDAIGTESGYNEIFHDELSDLSEYIIDSLTGGNTVHVSHSDDKIVFTVAGTDFMKLIQNENKFSFQFEGSTTPQGNIPFVNFSHEEFDSYSSCSGDLRVTGEEDNVLIDFSFMGDQIPKSFPSDIDFSIVLSQSGDILPVFTCKANIFGNRDGHVQADFFLKRQNDNSEFIAFSINGNILKNSTKMEPTFSYEEFMQSFNIFSINDITLPQFISSITKPFFTGALLFLEEVPASSFQSIMNDLTDSGLLNMLLIN